MPRIAALLQMCAFVQDSETEEEATFYRNLTTSFFGSDPKRIRWDSPDDPPSTETHLSRHDAAVTEHTRSVFDSILKGKTNAS